MTNEDKMDINHIAVSMYAVCVEERTAEGKGEIFKRNPDARELFFAGVHDTIMTVQDWMDAGITPELMNQFITALHDQTCTTQGNH